MKTLLKAHGLLIPSNLDPVGFKRNLCFIILTDNVEAGRTLLPAGLEVR